MDDFLLDDAPKSNYACNSIEDLQLQLADLRQAKVTDTKAEHISATFEFRSTVVFNVPENENDGADVNQSLDPALGGSSAAAPDAPTNGHGMAPPSTREVRAHETVMNQPTDDPALQKVVAKHIITSLGTVDGSAWIVRSVSRNASGWTFHYLCRNSTQAWQRQNSKNAAKVLVSESSGKDGQDPINLGEQYFPSQTVEPVLLIVIVARPAFDCRGSVTISFAKNSRMITVKLDHTPFHKTVADLAELYKPPPPPARAEVARRKDGEGRKRKSLPAEGAEGEELAENERGARKKRKKKNHNPDGLDAQDQQVPKPKKPRKPKATNSNGAGGQAEGDDQQNNPLLNISPSEAARRRDGAIQKLTENGIDAKTLSVEQFEIFANQSPDLQTESLAMLIKYGAERLRIVHPNKDNGSSGTVSANGATSESSTKKKKSKKRELNEDGTPKEKKTRGGCQACRAKKLKASQLLGTFMMRRCQLTIRSAQN